MQDEEHGIAELFDSCANYGNSEALQELASSGLPFHASHGAGGNYGQCIQASDGQQFVDVEGDDDGYPVVRVLKNGRIERQRLREARRYWRVHKRVREMLGEVAE